MRASTIMAAILALVAVIAPYLIIMQADASSSCKCSGLAMVWCIQAPAWAYAAAALICVSLCITMTPYLPSMPMPMLPVLQEPEGPEAVRDWWSRHPSSWTQSDALVAAGAMVVARARAAVKEALGFTCSAGIAHSKILAKLGSGLHKPAQQTVVPGELISDRPALHSNLACMLPAASITVEPLGILYL